ncbi:MAG: CvpA family protein [Bacteroidales bacterium]|nr:CvpA family protein [Bacteroidales bacterium]
MNTFDLIIIAFLVIGASVGLYRGFFKELVGTVGLLVAAIVANLVSPYAKPWLGDIITDELVAAVLLWVVTFLLTLFVMNRVAWLLGKVFTSLSIGWVNRISGALFGMIKYALIAALFVSALEFAAAHVDGLKFVESMQQSRLIPFLHRIVEVVMPWASEHILSPALDMFKK